MTTHDYLSTACAHGQCGSCRNTCKFCPSSCTHDCHPQQDGAPVSPVDDARNIAMALFEALGDDIYEHPELVAQVRDDPGLFWLRGEVQPPGEWAPEGTTS